MAEYDVVLTDEMILNHAKALWTHEGAVSALPSGPEKDAALITLKRLHDGFTADLEANNIPVPDAGAHPDSGGTPKTNPGGDPGNGGGN